MKHIVNWLPTAVVTAAVLWLTLAPVPVPYTGVHLFEGADKVVHFLMFFGLTVIVLLDLKRHKGALTPKAMIAVWAIVTLFAGADEAAQSSMGLGRTSDILDFASDCAGVLTATVGMWLFRRGAK